MSYIESLKENYPTSKQILFLIDTSGALGLTKHIFMKKLGYRLRTKFYLLSITIQRANTASVMVMGTMMFSSSFIIIKCFIIIIIIYY